MKSSLLSLQLVANRVLAGVRLLGQVRNMVLFQVRSVVESRPRRRVRTITATPPAHLPLRRCAWVNSARSLRRCGLALYSALLLVVTWARSQRANVTCSYMLTGLRPGPGKEGALAALYRPTGPKSGQKKRRPEPPQSGERMGGVARWSARTRASLSASEGIDRR
jgi:hypothetical protein